MMPLPAPLSRRHLLMRAGVAVIAGNSEHTHAQESVSLGVVPYLPVRRLISLYAPLVPVMEQALNRPVDIVSANSWRQHLEMLRAGAFDITIDSVVMTRIAQRELGHIPMVRTLAPLEPILVIPKTSAIRDFRELKGKAICVTDRIASLSIFGLRHLRDNHLVPDKDFQVIVSGSHSNALHRMLSGDAAAALVSRTTLIQVSADLTSQVKVLSALPPAFSAVVYHAAPRMAAHVPTLARDMVRFAQGTPKGKAFIESLGHIGLAPVQPNQLKSLDPMVVEFYRQLA